MKGHPHMSWISPFSLPGQWYKGNLHTHTTRSDGRVTPEEAIAWYRQRGYDFLALTDHWVLTPGIPGTPGRQVGLDFVTLSGAELDGPGYHMVALGLTALPEQAEAQSAEAAARAVSALGGLAIAAHPYWLGQTSADLAGVADIVGLEVFNAVCEVMDRRGQSTVHWDELLSRRRRLWGFAVDDGHFHEDAQGIGYVMVRAPSLDEGSILAALRSGAFYSSTGPTIADLRLVQGQDRLSLRVRCSPCRSITFYADQPMHQRHDAPPGATLDEAACPMKPELLYLRVACTDDAGRTAWSNPVYVADALAP